jgi:DNA-binding beta-propeller fold protein YncE
MIRYGAVLLAAMLLGSGIAAAKVSRASTPLPVGHRHGGWMARGANPKHSWLYVSGYNSNNIAIFDLAQVGNAQIGSITAGLSAPGAMTVDAQGTLYVVNGFGGNVTIYPAGSTSPSLTLSASLIDPTGVAVDAAGNVYVTTRNEAKTTSSVVEFPPGGTTPSQVITSDLMTNVIAETIDAAGNVYIADYNKGVSEIAGGSSQVVSLGLLRWTHTNGIAIDPANGDLFVGDGPGDMRVRVYAPGNLSPERTLQGRYVAWALASGAIGKHEYIFVPDAPNFAVHVFRDKSNKVFSTISSAQTADIAGVAFKPAGVP